MKYSLIALIFTSLTLSAYAGTPGMNDASILYAIVLVGLLMLIGAPFAKKYIMKKWYKVTHTEQSIDKENSELDADLKK